MSQPSGASVEINGIEVGKTPYSVEIPSSYVHGGKTVFTKFLREQMHLRLTLDGYLPKDVDLANRPISVYYTEWRQSRGRLGLEVRHIQFQLREGCNYLYR